MSLRQHTSQEFEAELESVRQRISEMGRHVTEFWSRPEGRCWRATANLPSGSSSGTRRRTPWNWK